MGNLRSAGRKAYEKAYKKTEKYKATQVARRKRISRTGEYKLYWRDYWLRKKYGIGYHDFLNLFALQKGRCAICQKPQWSLNVKLNVDHCHRTGVVRGLLCNNCNRGIGHLMDSAELLEKAIQYLKKGK